MSERQLARTPWTPPALRARRARSLCPVLHAVGVHPAPWDAVWVAEFKAAHGGRDPNEQDWQDHLLSQRYPGNGAGGKWSDADWQTFYRLVDLLGGDLLSQIGKKGGSGTGFYTSLGVLLAFWRLEDGPDGTRIGYTRNFPVGSVPPNTTGWTWGNVILLLETERANRALLMHEYSHVLQYRFRGIGYVPNYLKGGLYNWETNPSEMQAVEVQQIYDWNAWLPPIWEIFWIGGRSQ